MSYRRALVTRWSRRDRLAVLVVAVAFLTGVTLLLLAAGVQTASVAAQVSWLSGGSHRRIR